MPHKKPQQRKSKVKHKAGSDGNILTLSHSELKWRIRGIERLLRRDDGSTHATVRLEHERKLAALKFQLEQSSLNEKERKLALMYRKVKFFERQKIVRKLKSVRKQLLQDDDNTELKSRLKELEVDLCYVFHYPKTKKYISLFPPTPITDPSVLTEQHEIRSNIANLIETCVIDPISIEERVLDEDKEKKKTKGKKLKEGEEKNSLLGLAARGLVSFEEIAQNDTQSSLVAEEPKTGAAELRKRKAGNQNESSADAEVELSTSLAPVRNNNNPPNKKPKLSSSHSSISDALALARTTPPPKPSLPTCSSKPIPSVHTQAAASNSKIVDKIEFEASPLRDDFFLFDDGEDKAVDNKPKTRKLKQEQQQRKVTDHKVRRKGGGNELDWRRLKLVT